LKKHFCLLGLLALTVVSCSETSTHSETRFIGSTPALITTADLRLVTERPLPVVDSAGQSIGTHQVICTEPSPDIAKALSTLSTGQGGFNLSLPIAGAVVNAAASGAASRGTAEQLAQLTERVPPIQALRDGLYRACEAYANQAIGRNAYALILSRYGELLTTLLLAEATAGEYGHTLAALQGLGLNPSVTAPSLPAVQNAVPKADKAGAAAAVPAPAAGTVLDKGNQSPIALPVLKIADPPSAPAGAANPVTPARPQRPGSASIPGTVAASTIPGSIGNNVPAALEQMQFNYLKLNHITPLLLLCANNLDKSIPGNVNTWPDVATCSQLAKSVVESELNYSQLGAAQRSTTTSSRR
jgi:hypothetical protein